jgi:hypothetical protein
VPASGRGGLQAQGLYFKNQEKNRGRCPHLQPCEQGWPKLYKKIAREKAAVGFFRNPQQLFFIPFPVFAYAS